MSFFTKQTRKKIDFYYSYVIIILPLLLLPSATAASRGLVGVMYRVDIPGIPEPKKVVSAIVEARIPRVRLVGANAKAIGAFVGTGIDINLSIQDLALFTEIGKNSTFALDWVGTNIAPSHPQAGISFISVGIGIFSNFPNVSDLVLPAVKNVHYACRNLSLDGITVSTGNAFSVLTKAFPPSEAEFNNSVVPYMAPLLDFAEETGAAFQINLFPFEVYRSKAIKGLTTGFVMFEAWEGDYLVDPNTKLTYSNLYNVMVDAAVSALVKMNHSKIPIVVIGTGWPSDGNKVLEPEASMLYAAEYNERLVSLINMRGGTPLRRNTTPVTYLYGLFDEPRKKGVVSFDNNWGIWMPDMTIKYQIDFELLANSTSAARRQEWLLSCCCFNIWISRLLFLTSFMLLWP